MDHEQAKGAANKTKDAVKDTDNPTQGKFDKPLGSSHNDEVDLRDVVRKAAERSK
jgi:hypothetical protein